MKEQEFKDDGKIHDVHNAVAKAQVEVSSSREPWYQVLKKARFLIAFYLIEFVLFTALAWFVHVHPVWSIDVMITKEFQENQSPWLRDLMIVVSYPGNQFWLSITLIALAAIFFWLVRLRLEASFIVGLSIVSMPLNGLIKYIVSRPRPTTRLVDIIQRASGQSFPSGHVMAYVAFWGLLFSFGLILFKRNRWWNYLLLIIPAFFVVLVGPSRIYLGDHWASDVLGGYLFGGLLLGLALWLYLVLKQRGVLAPKVKTPQEHISEPPPPADKHTHTSQQTG